MRSKGILRLINSQRMLATNTLGRKYPLRRHVCPGGAFELRQRRAGGTDDGKVSPV
jgi:hypothetical protein